MAQNRLPHEPNTLATGAELNFLGIDPGQSGALVILDDGGVIKSLCVMPLGPDGQPSFSGIKGALDEAKKFSPETLLERAVSFGMGGLSAFNYGRGFAALEIALQELRMPYTLIEPRKWTKVMFQGIDSRLKPKEQALIAIDRLMPSEKSKIPVTPRSKKLHEGVIDATLIAEYGRRTRLCAS